MKVTRPPTLFTQTGCADSPRVRAWLADRGIGFVERNVSDDATAARDLVATGIFATPLFVAGQRRVFGFRPALLAAAVRGEGNEE